MKMHALSRKEKIRRNNISEKKDGMKNIIKNEKKILDTAFLYTLEKKSNTLL